MNSCAGRVMRRWADSMRGLRLKLAVPCALALLLLVAPASADEVKDAIDAALSAYQGGDVTGSIAALEKVKTANPKDVRPIGNLAFILLDSNGDLGRVFDLLLEYLDLHQQNEWALREVARVADRALAGGRPELARNCAKVLMAAEPGDKQHRYLWARASYRLGRRDSVAEVCRSLIDDYPSWELPYWLLARTLSDHGEQEEVVQIYRELLKELPGNVDARLRMARAQLDQRDYDAAEDTYRSALEIAAKESRHRAMAEDGIFYVKSARDLSERLRKQSAFLDRMLLFVGAGWGVVILFLVVVTRRKR